MTVGDMILRSSIFPPRKCATMRYSQTISMTAFATNQTVERAFALNGLAAVDLTIAGGNPWRWGTITTIYQQYLVLRTRFCVQYSDPNQDGVIVGVALRGPTTNAITPGEVMTRPGTTYSTISNSGEQFATFKGDIMMPQAMGVEMMHYRADYGAGIATNPGISSDDFTCYLRCFAASTTGVDAPFRLNVAFEFQTEFFDLAV